MALPVYVRVKVFSGNTDIDRLICALLDCGGIDASPIDTKHHGDILEGVRLILSGLFIEDPNQHMEEIISSFPEYYRRFPVIGMTSSEIYRNTDSTGISSEFANLGVTKIWYQLHGGLALLHLIEEQLKIDIISEIDEADLTTFNNLLSCVLGQLSRVKVGEPVPFHREISKIPSSDCFPGEIRQKLFPSRRFLSALRGTSIFEKAA